MTQPKNKLLNMTALTSLFAFAFFMQTSGPPIRAKLQDLGGEVYNVKGFGATGNGTTNDWTAVSNAITAAGTSGTVVFPAGQYRLGTHNLAAASVFLQTGAIFKVLTGETVTIGAVDGTIDKHFDLAGTGIVQFCDLGTTPTCTPRGPRVIHFEWWGAVADASTVSLTAMRQAAAAIRPNMTLQLHGTYQMGTLTNAVNGLYFDADNYTVQGPGGTWDSAKLLYTSSTHTRCLGIPICSGLDADASTHYHTGVVFQNFTMEDENALTGPDPFVGASAMVLYKVDNFSIRNVKYYNTSGNSPIQLSCGTQAVDDKGGGRIDHVWITTDSTGDKSYFSGINWGSCSPFTVINSHIDGFFWSGAIGGGEANRYGDVRIQDNFIDAIDSVHGAATSCIGPGGVPNHTTYIIGNTCKDFGAADNAIFLGNETGGPASDNGFKNVVIANNVVNSGIGGQPTYALNLISSYQIEQITVHDNYLKSAYAIALASKDMSAVNPGDLVVDIHDNVFNQGASASGNLSISAPTCDTLPATFSWSIHDNMMIGFTANSGGQLYRPSNNPCVNNRKFKHYNNSFNVDQFVNYTGTPYFIGGGSVVSGSGTSALTQSYEGVIPGDDVRFLGLSSAFNAPPAGVSIHGYVTTTNVVQLVIDNRTGTSFDPTGANVPHFVVERRK